MTRAYIGVGSNISPKANVEAALALLTAEVRLMAISTFYLTPAEGRPEQPDYLNGVVAVETDLPALQLKQGVLAGIERRLGRQRGEDRYAARPIDLDLLLYDSLSSTTPELRLPAPDIEKRAFVAVPLAEIAPDLELPGTGLSAHAIAARFAEARMRPLVRFSQDLRRRWFASGARHEH